MTELNLLPEPVALEAHRHQCGAACGKCRTGIIVSPGRAGDPATGAMLGTGPWRVLLMTPAGPGGLAPPDIHELSPAAALDLAARLTEAAATATRFRKEDDAEWN